MPFDIILRVDPGGIFLIAKDGQGCRIAGQVLGQQKLQELEFLLIEEFVDSLCHVPLVRVEEDSIGLCNDTR